MGSKFTKTDLQQITDYVEFESFCHNLLAMEGYAHIEPLGGGKDKGRDAIHVDRSTGKVTIFAYSVRQDWENKLDEDLGKIRKHGHACDEVVFLTTGSPTAGEKDKKKKAVKEKHGWGLEFYDLERISTLVDGRHRQLRDLHPQIFLISSKLVETERIRRRRIPMLALTVIFILLMASALSVWVITRSSQSPPEPDSPVSVTITQTQTPEPPSTTTPPILTSTPTPGPAVTPQVVVRTGKQKQVKDVESQPRVGPTPQSRPDPVETQKGLNDLVGEIQEQIGRGRSFDFADLAETKARVRVWKETNEALAGRIDKQMKLAFGAETDYAQGFAFITHSIYYWTNEEDERESARKEVETELKKLRSLQDEVRRDSIRYGGIQH